VQACHLAAAALMLLAACRTPPPGARQVRVAAAADLRFALEAAAREFRAVHPDVAVEAAYGSSGNFHAQLLHEAPFDVFLSADLAYPQDLARRGRTLDGWFPYAAGKIVVWTPAGSPLDLERRGLEALSDPGVRHVAIAHPEHAPYGRAAEAALRAHGLYDAVAPKLVLGENVSQTMQFVQTGGAEAGIVALSLALAPAARQTGQYWEIPPASYPRIEQGGAILKWARDPEAARAFRDFLTAPAGRAILKANGFDVPKE
jgi:molybdate transport system substrate-binding protein